MLKKRYTILCVMLLLTTIVAQAQISIKGNVYGGGNEGNLVGGTKVVVRAGDIDGSVYGGARQANVGGATFVNIDGEHMSGDILINYVYGGNDIAGTIGTSPKRPAETVTTTDPETGEVTVTPVPLLTKAEEYGIDNTFNSFVLTTKERTTSAGEQPYKAYIGQLFAGGNGDYTYSNRQIDNGKEKYDVTVKENLWNEQQEQFEETEVTKSQVSRPDLDKAYIEMRGGSCMLLYGGGNNVTIKEETHICIDNASTITYDMFERDANGDETAVSKFTDERLKRMGIFALGSAGEDVANSDAYQFARVFGGNNKAPMSIRPQWHLEKGLIRNLYSGGNRGDMTHRNGIFLPIHSDDVIINNLYGGCRMANVNPDRNEIEAENFEIYKYVDGVKVVEEIVDCPPQYAARVHVGGGQITNVYGGNDVSGMVYGGNAVGIHHSVKGNVYGGGNGSYAYTDNPDLAYSDLYGDYFYDVNKLLGLADGTPITGMNSVEALNRFRPNAEAVSVRLIGTENKRTTVDGAVYCGGNSATLENEDADKNATAELKIGAYVYADQIFLGNNGENMLTTPLLERYAKHVDNLGNVTDNDADADFSKIDLLNPSQFATYMKGCEMRVKPDVVMDYGYSGYSTYFGSFYCGGNRGSVNFDGMNTINFTREVVIYDKLVGGSNDAYIKAGTYNAAYEGGIIGEPAEAPSGKIGDKLKLNLAGLKIQPKRWKMNGDNYVLDANGNREMEWNVYTNLGVKDVSPTTVGAADETGGNSTDADLNRRFQGGNIYGGCYTSGHVNGNVIININASLVDTDMLFDKVTLDDEGEEKLFAGDDLHPEDKRYFIEERRSGVILNQQGVDVLGNALNVFGGGKGKDTEIWGSTTINLNEKSYVFRIFGGSEEGVIGQSTGTSTAINGTYVNGIYSFNGKSYEYNPNYSCTANLKGENAGVAKNATSGDKMADCEYIYAGGYIGPICGNAIINLGNGRIYQSFGGACNADILGHTETYIGRQINDDGTIKAEGGFPYIRDFVYGANDMGGRILGSADFTATGADRIRHEVAGLTLPGEQAAKEVSAYVEYTQGHAVGIYGGCYGTYDYTDPEYSEYFDATTGKAKPGYTKPRLDNAFVNVRPTLTNQLKANENNTMSEVYGAGEGASGDPERDIMQNRSYVLIDIPQEMDNFKDMQVFGAGAWSGLGMREYVAPVATPDAEQEAALNKMSAIIDLPRGQVNAVYGGSYQEGFTRRTVVNVPEKSTIKLNKIFGGAYGLSNDTVCDVYEGNVTWSSSDALVSYIFGGNNNARRTLYGRVNINAPVWTNKTSGYMASVYGAGCGENTWSQYTEVNMNKGSQVYMVYGGGQNGRVCNLATARQISIDEFNDTEFKGLKIADPYENGEEIYTYADGLNNPLAKPRHDGNRYNTNVIINKGAVIGSYVAGYAPGFNVGGGYAYGGGQGAANKNRSGDVNGTTYIALLGGTVEKDLVAAGSVGSVFDRYGNLTDDFGNHFVASTTAYVAAGVVRNVYGGGYMGSVGKHKTTEQLKDKDNNLVYEDEEKTKPVMIEVDAAISAPITEDIPAQANVIIGIREDQTEDNLRAQLNYVKRENGETEIADNAEVTPSDLSFYNGIPAIQRNVYGGGEGETKKGGRGGAIFGTANVVVNNGRIGYDYLAGKFLEKLNDETWMESDSTGRLKDYGNIFGGGYSDKSNVDSTKVTLWGGLIRGSVHGGAEVAAIGRGSTAESGEANSVRVFGQIYLPGKTHVEIYNGHVLRNVFGGGKGYNVLGFGGANELYTDGYVFGQTEVLVHGGEIGTAESVKEGKNNGNVFGGGDLGYVYSRGYDNTKTKADKASKKETGSPDHYYYYYNGYKCTSAYDRYKENDVIEACVYDMMSAADKSHWTNATEPTLTEDCKVVVAPYLQVRSDFYTINGKTKAKYEYVETDDLNTLPKDKNAWADLFTGDKLENGDPNPADPDERGVLIHNAVFGGGNVSSNSDTHYANATTVFGNTTATLYDCYHRDFITIGTEHTGGLYGGGNLSKSDGYRELNITNYGTDYYGLSSQISLEEYKNLSNRERAYFQLEYVCKDGTDSKIVNNETKQGVYVGDEFYENGQRVKEEDYDKLKVITTGSHPFNAANWEQFGFCSIYAGRLLNTIQRADLCGVFGSRMVLQGAKDRVAEIGEDIDYTINRVGELSLNKQRSVRPADIATADSLHGNYFGIYSIVNYLGNLTSDVHFSDPLMKSDGTEEADSYFLFKSKNYTRNNRNNGKSFNQVALASGVFLELTTEYSTADEKAYGLISGVVELDLINVKNDQMGGGFVYAKNEHRVPMCYPNVRNVILSEYNKQTDNEAVTFKRLRYDPDDNTYEWDNAPEGAYNVGHEMATAYSIVPYETSGNFIHPTKRIIDDCYPINNAYDPDQSPYAKAHYWYIKGSVYVYDQVVSAYTGSPNSYSKHVHLPLTITAASNGRLRLINVKPNLYAYYYEEGKKIGTEGNDGKAWVNNNADMYKLNDVITWWEWNHLSTSDKKLFVKETVVNCKPCQIDGKVYDIGEYVMLPTDIDGFKTDNHTIKDTDGEDLTDEKGDKFESQSDLIDDLFRSSNNIGNESGYVLTVDMNTPKVWNDYFTLGDSEQNNAYDLKITKEAYDGLTPANKNLYVEGPTYHPAADGIYGQRDYEEGDIVTKTVYDKIPDTSEFPQSGKNYMEVAYVATSEASYTYQGQSKTVNAGTAIPETEYNALSTEKKALFGKAWICTDALKLAENAYIVNGDLYTAEEIAAMKAAYGEDVGEDEIDASLKEAYICTKTGEYGGQKFYADQNYSALESWCSLDKDDRDAFTYNYDALDLFADPNYLDFYSQDLSDVKTIDQAYHEPYSNLVPVEYKAVYKEDTPHTVEFIDGTESRTFTKGEDNATLTHTQFENVRNDKRYYTRIVTGNDQSEAYVVAQNFTDNGIPYGIGQVVDEALWNLYQSSGYVEKVTGLTQNSITYYCFQEHQEGENTVSKNTRISEYNYKNTLVDHQKYFIIQGQEPTETTTLYVNRESDYKDMTSDRIITAIYQYTYYENGDDDDIKLTNELHVVNIHLELKSGQPIIGQLNDPPIVLPGSSVGLDRPEVIPGIYEVLINGWMLYPNKNDAEHHRNGEKFVNNQTPVYWYQNNDYYVSFYSKTYKGYTYSNPVPLHVANYHDIGEVMEQHKDNHLYIDRADVDRPAKIYINDYSSLGADDPRSGKNGLDELKNLFDLSLLRPTQSELDENGLITTEGTFKGHAPFGSHIEGAKNLEFILRTNLNGTVPEGEPERTSIAAGTGETDPCFAGNLHGDGHTISGLTHSLFGKLCGNVYNLGVTGSFTSAGIADAGDGFVENCWVKSSATALPDGASKTNAVFGNPSDPDNPDCIQVVNCYYPESNAALYHATSAARKMPEKAFYDGTVAYNLNGFYLAKRYYDGSQLNTGAPYNYIPAKADGTLPTNTDGTMAVSTQAYYPASAAYYTPQGTPLTPNLGYVEHRFYDGDFRFADGTVPTALDIRRQDKEIDDETSTTIFAPIWPDDYLYFGQALNYGYVEGRTHQMLPSIINKSSDRLRTDANNNRVYRAPAYFRNGDMQAAHFNPTAVFAQAMKNDATKIAHKDMTAIDFTGYNDASNGYKNSLTTAAPYNHIEGGAFFPPLLDDGGLTSFQNVNLTRNLLVYTGEESADPNTPLTISEKTANVVSTKLHDYEYKEDNATYHTVRAWDRSSNYSGMMGHWVKKSGNDYVAALDHLLVDGEDFNAPISYTFATDKRMWYQRTPDNFVDKSTGWEGVSLPFETEIVTTNAKGELTHFYEESKIGHEYWLREFKGNVTQKEGDIYTADFNPLAGGSHEKDYTNTFLHDYYYKYEKSQDKNTDEYHKEYYSTEYLKELYPVTNYPYAAKGTPYIVGFPGATYYEFDLSGEWTPQNIKTDPNTIASPGKQTITFASEAGTSIAVSDSEKSGVSANSNYTFSPTYLNDPEAEDASVFLLNANGSSYSQTTATAGAIKAFRPYFKASSQAKARHIIFNKTSGTMQTDPSGEETGDGALLIYTKKEDIIVTSTLREPTSVQIFTAGGVRVATFTIQPSETITTTVGAKGVYIVNQKKIAIR